VSCSDGGNDLPPHLDCIVASDQPPQYQLNGATNELLECFATSHEHDEVHSLWLHTYSCDDKGFAHLKRLNNLYVLTLSDGGWNPNPIEMNSEGYVFNVALSDEEVKSIAKVRSLRRINLWYGRFSQRQKDVLQKALPACKLVDSLNRL
jgi:hypothetical protein